MKTNYPYNFAGLYLAVATIISGLNATYTCFAMWLLRVCFTTLSVEAREAHLKDKAKEKEEANDEGAGGATTCKDRGGKMTKCCKNLWEWMEDKGRPIFGWKSKQRYLLSVLQEETLKEFFPTCEEGGKW